VYKESDHALIQVTLRVSKIVKPPPKPTITLGGRRAAQPRTVESVEALYTVRLHVQQDPTRHTPKCNRTVTSPGGGNYVRASRATGCAIAPFVYYHLGLNCNRNEVQPTGVP